MAASILFLGFLVLSFSFALASDPSSLQDFCVADGDSNGLLKILKFTSSFLISLHCLLILCLILL
jgi:hypothetical protein